MSSLVNFEISSVLNNKSRKISAYTVNQLNVSDNKINISNLKRQFPHLRSINFPTSRNSEIALLIGTNNADFLIHKDFRVGKEGEPLTVETLLGWTIMGGNYNVNKKGVTKQELSSDQEKNCNSFSKRSIEILSNDLKQFWDAESYGTLPQHHLLLLTPEENRSLNVLETTTSLKNGDFEVGFFGGRNTLNFPLIES